MQPLSFIVYKIIAIFYNQTDFWGDFVRKKTHVSPAISRFVTSVTHISSFMLLDENAHYLS